MRFLLILLIFINSNIHGQSTRFFKIASDIARKDTVKAVDIENLLSFEEDIKVLYQNVSVRRDSFYLFNRISNLLNNYLTTESGYTDSLSSKKLYILTLLNELGNKADLKKQQTKYQRFYATYNILFGQGYSRFNGSKRYAGRSLWGSEEVLDIYIFNKKSNGTPSKFFLTPGVGFYLMLQDTSLKRLLGPKIGIGYDLKNVNSFALSTEYLFNLDGKNFFGIDASFIAEAFQFGAKSFFRNNETVQFLYIKYDVWRIFRNRRY